MNTLELFRRFNFYLLNEIMDRDFGIIECGSIINPKNEIFNNPLNGKACLKKKKEPLVLV
ncbi:hypothetical protein [Flavobacterium crassostreae]|uniref:Uncharacterized protein n=1 Tax=Flavobacterium crassostreae TaxID=1763534 RepID=A0A1B9E7S8_9FLAO|nr:hypothetical protein [Flavobacterium crassostreae]OCB77999.1 hypothetical protein LPBF_03355 [Flavobacterium crassostreae]